MLLATPFSTGNQNSLMQASAIALLTFVVVAANAFTLNEIIHQNGTLFHHNALRARHCAAPLTLDASLSKIAQDYADYLARTGRFEHSNNGLGENLYMMSSSAVLGTVDGKVATQDWYNEIKFYNFNNPGFSSKTGHFTQVVWKGSKLLGVGLGYSSDKRKVYIVCNYSPPGNYMGQFPQQVGSASC